MADYAAGLVQMIDSRVAAGQEMVARMGTVTTRATDGTSCYVIFDGSSGQPQPVKCFENVIVTEGDRVGCIKVQSDWVVFGNYLLYTLADVNTYFTYSSTATYASATIADMPSSPSVTFFKVRDFTKLRLHVTVSCYATVASTALSIYLNVTSSSGITSYDVECAHHNFNPATTHMSLGGTSTTPTADPADEYAVTARWARTTGTGTLTVDVNDRVSIDVREVYQ